MRIEEVTSDNVGAACRLAVKPEQEQFVAPVAVSLAEAYTQPSVAWPRLMYDGDDLVGFVMGAFDPGNPLWFFRCGIWRLNVAADAQRCGVGRFAVDAVLAEARRRGEQQASVLWVPGPGGPEGFYDRLGFKATGEEFQGETIGRIALA